MILGNILYMVSMCLMDSTNGCTHMYAFTYVHVCPPTHTHTYIHLLPPQIVHRTLCCRHVLVGAGFDIKVYNVGSYDVAVDTQDGLLKWMAPETLFDGNYSMYTDM